MILDLRKHPREKGLEKRNSNKVKSTVVIYVSFKSEWQLMN